MARWKGTLTESRFDEGLELDFGKLGHLDSFFFDKFKSEDINTRLRKTESFRVCVVQAGRRDYERSHVFSHECFGIVVEAKNDSRVRPGDVVISLTGSMIESKMVVADSSCLRCRDKEEATKLVGLVDPFCRTYLILVEIARLRRGDFVLLKSSDPLLQHVLEQVVNHFEATAFHAETDESTEPRKLNIVIDTDGDCDFEGYRSRLALVARLIRQRSDDMSASESPKEAGPGALAMILPMSMQKVCCK